MRSEVKSLAEMKQKARRPRHLRVIIWGLGFIGSAVGLAVMFGWIVHSPALVQISPRLAPMQFNAALSFLLCGIALLAAGSAPRLSVAAGGLVASIGLLTLFEYAAGIDIGIDELLMKHDITVETSQPGRMAPNTALCFLFFGLANGVLAGFRGVPERVAIKGVLNAVIVALGAVALFGYLFDLEGAYGWGALTRMAVHTAVGFVLLGVGGVLDAWLEEDIEGRSSPGWSPAVIFISGTTVTVCLCLAVAAELTIIDVETGNPHNPFIEFLVLIFGISLSGSLASLYIKARDANQRAEEAAKAQREAEQANKIKSEFLASMSHEIRTPMTSVMGMADLILDDPLTQEARQKVFKIKDATRSLLKIVNDILDISKMESGKLEIEHVDFDLRNLIQDVLALFEEKRKGGRRKALEMSVALGNDVPDVVNGDPTRLRQVLINLVGNAVKFTQEGTVQVRVERDAGLGKDHLRFLVEDTGIGLSEAVLETIFDDFTQADSSIRRQYEGSGLGLAISKRLVETMGGQIGVQSRPGVGSVFWFTLAFYHSTGRTRPETVISRPADGQYEAQRSLTVLVAEDNAINQQIISAYLKRLGHRYVVASSGLEALQVYGANRFDLILMDIRMPEMSGLDATKRIREMEGGKGAVPIIALSADAVEENVQEYLKTGIDGFVAKPIDPDELALTINKVLGQEVHIFKPGKGGGAAEKPVFEQECAVDENDQDIAGLLEKMDASGRQ